MNQRTVNELLAAFEVDSLMCKVVCMMVRERSNTRVRGGKNIWP